MEHAYPFVVLTLLQLCGAEIPNAQSEWYAANLINDASYLPKPLTEIFSTDASFTLRTTDAPRTIQTQTTAWSTTTTNTPSATRPSTWPSTQTQMMPQLENIVRPQPPPAMSQVTTNPPQANWQPQTQPQIQQPQVNWQPQTLPQTQIPQVNWQPQTQSATQIPQVNWQPQTQPSTQIPQVIRQTQTQPPIQSSSQPTPQSTVQSIPQLVLQSPQTTTLGLWRNQGNLWRSNQFGNRPNLWDPNQLNWMPNQQGIQPFLPLAVPQDETPIILPSGPLLSAPCDRRNNPISSQGSILSNIPQSPLGTYVNASLMNETSGLNPLLTISVRRQGSRTNVLINPSTTSATTTTRRKTRRNNYDMCVDTCRNRREPICATPRGVTPINPDNLKGFPSMCNLACQNNFRNQQYDKVADGRCGKLRTRIRPMGQDKLNKNDLNKAQYSLVHNGDETLIQFAQLPRAA